MKNDKEKEIKEFIKVTDNLRNESDVFKKCIENIIKKPLNEVGYFYVHKLYDKSFTPSVHDVKVKLPEESFVREMYMKKEEWEKKFKNSDRIMPERKKDFVCKKMLKYLEENSKEALSYNESFYILFFLSKVYSNEVLDSYLENRIDHRQYTFEKGKGLIYDHERIEIKSITSLDGFIKELQNLSDDMNDENKMFYRGHGDISYKLIPGLYRNKSMIKNEDEIINQLFLRCSEEFKKEHSHIEILTKMQHYGLPTRLMDITSNPLVALYFAVKNSTRKMQGEVIVFQESRKKIKYLHSDTVSIIASASFLSESCKEKIMKIIENDSIIERDDTPNLYDEIRRENPVFECRIKGNDLKRNIFVCPPQNNKRIQNQNGAFIICGLLPKAYISNNKEEKLFIKAVEDQRYPINKKKKIIYVIDAREKEKIKEQLDKIGINEFFVYPELERAANHIKNKYYGK